MLDGRPRLKKFLKIALLVAVVVGIGIQFVPVKGIGVNPPARHKLDAPPEVEAILRESCFDLINLDDKINCGLPCAQDAGILSSSDPVISTYLVGLIACAQEKCAEPCHFSEAGVGL